MRFLNFLDAEMTQPTPYGWFHLLCFGIVIALCVLIIVFRKKIAQKGSRTINNILLVTGIVMILFEIYKQIIMNFEDGAFTPYAWYIFPFQFCSTPMYLMTLAGILRKGKVYDCLISYLGTFSLFAGLCVMFLPTTVFIPTIGINIQTMVVHGGMIVIGVLLIATQTMKAKWETLLKATIVFAILASVALLINVIWHYAGTGDEFNMFFISPWFDCELILLQDIQNVVPYVVFLLIYLIGFTACAGLVLSVPILINKINSKKSS